MPINKQGHFIGAGPIGPRGPRGIGFNTTESGDFSLSGKRLLDLETSLTPSDHEALNYGFLKKYFKLDAAGSIGVLKNRLSDISYGAEDCDAVSKAQLRDELVKASEELKNALQREIQAADKKSENYVQNLRQLLYQELEREKEERVSDLHNTEISLTNRINKLDSDLISCVHDANYFRKALDFVRSKNDAVTINVDELKQQLTQLAETCSNTDKQVHEIAARMEKAIIRNMDKYMYTTFNARSKIEKDEQTQEEI